MKTMTTTHLRLLRRSFVRGLGSLIAISPPNAIAAYPHKDEAEALSSDWVSIGKDMNVVLNRRYKDVEKARKKYSKITD
jgi:hypothetical protein